MKVISTGSKERWRPVVGFEHRYEVSDLGRVRSKDMLVGARGGGVALRKGRMLKPVFCVFGYPKLSLTDGPKRIQRNVHVLVLEAFRGPRPQPYPLCHARHLNGDERDCRLKNLVWGSALANNQDKEIHGTLCKGETVGTSKLKERQVLSIRRSKLSSKALASKYAISEGHVYQIRSRRCWRHLP
jgi:hypothetical protein